MPSSYLTIVPTQSNIFQALGRFLTAVLPANTKVLQGQVNRVPEPENSNFAVMWALRFPRLATNIDDFADAVFTGSISGATLTITSVDPRFSNRLGVDSILFGVNVAPNTRIIALGTGTGGLGTYTISPSPQAVSSETFAAGGQSLLQKAEAVFQVDIHGPSSADNAQLISTTFRDAYGVDLFKSFGFDIAPLYTSDPRQMPFLNGEQQYEDRFIIETHMQVNQTLTVTQQFADIISIELIEVDTVYPPT